MVSVPELSHAGRIARAHDPDRFLTTLFAPADRRETLFLLIAFNHELVRALEMPSVRGESGPIAALIRLQWWREVVEGSPRRHELAEPLAAAISAGALHRETLLSVIEAREAEAESIDTLQRWREIQLEGPGGIQVAFARALGEADPAVLEKLRSIGAAYGAGAICRHWRSVLRANRRPFPDDLLYESGSSRDAVHAADAVPVDLAPLRAAGRNWLAEAGHPRLGRARIAAGLAAILARRDLARPAEAAGSPRGLGDRLALTAAWLRGSP
jgi:phytoene synthase